MALVAHDEALSAVSTNGPDDTVVEVTHLKHPMGVGEGALPDSEPDKENVFGRHEDAECSAPSTIPDDLFGDDDDEADDNDFVPRGAHVRPTVMTPSTSSAGPIAVGKPTNGTSQAAARKDGATAKTGKQKDAKSQKDAKATK